MGLVLELDGVELVVEERLLPLAIHYRHESLRRGVLNTEDSPVGRGAGVESVVELIGHSLGYVDVMLLELPYDDRDLFFVVDLVGVPVGFGV